MDEDFGLQDESVVDVAEEFDVQVLSDDSSVLAQADSSEFYNKFEFPPTLGDTIDNCPSSNYKDVCSYVYAGWRPYSVLTYDFTVDAFYISSSAYSLLLENPRRVLTTSGFYRRFDVDFDNHTVSLLGTTLDKMNYSSSTLISNSFFFDAYFPLTYGVTEPEPTILPDGLIISATLLAICFFSLIYKMIKRVLF